jgi:hypothetical protein
MLALYVDVSGEDGNNMNYGYFAFALILILQVDPLFAFELKNPEPENRRMTIELEVVPTPPQKRLRTIRSGTGRCGATRRERRRIETRRAAREK